MINTAATRSAERIFPSTRASPSITWRTGREGETYEGIGRDRQNLLNFPLLADSDGPFGSLVSDSMKTRVTEACTRILWVTFAPPDTIIPLDEFASTMIRFNGGHERLRMQA